jgi:ATP-binding cassette subfamily C protein
MKSEIGGQRSNGNGHDGGFERLELNDVVYTYPNVEDPAVNGVSLELKRSESIAFVGTTGCGKSTLVNLILGLLEPQSGAIRVNGSDIFSKLPAWRHFLGYIPQTIFLLDDSIRANIAFGIPPDEVSEEQLRLSLKSACLDMFVESLSEGIDTIVGERGVRLSGGQRQRIGIARALYFDPEVLVMDEATSALDNKTEAEVMQAIQNLKKGRTLIMVAHRLSTVEDCDRLYYLQKGELIAQGSYDELIKRSEAFRETAGAVD